MPITWAMFYITMDLPLLVSLTLKMLVWVLIVPSMEDQKLSYGDFILYIKFYFEILKISLKLFDGIKKQKNILINLKNTYFYN